MRAVLAVFMACLLANSTFAESTLRSLPSSKAAPDTTRVIVKYHPGASVPMDSGGPGNTRIFNVKTEDAEAFAEQLRTQPGVDRLALDLVVQNPPLSEIPSAMLLSTRAGASRGVLPHGALYGNLNGTPTDPGFDQQLSWAAPDELNYGVQNILAGYLAFARNKKLRVGLLDSGFYPVADVVFAAGYNLSSVEGYGPAYLENEVNPACTSPHGTAVAGIVGATANNGIGIAGVLNAELIAARVLSCNEGVLSDAALGIRWLAGDPSVLVAPSLNEPVDIINASLGTEGSTCPFYLQEAIDYAYRKGILIVVAAGNDSHEAQRNTPANCQNVLTVGAVERSGTLAWFSNYGDLVDLAALGELVASVNQKGEISQWVGTSFATPLVTGAAGLLKQANPFLAPDELRSELIAGARPLRRPAAAGQGARHFRTGIVDVGASVRNVLADLNESLPTIRPVLDTIERCNREAYLANAPAGLDYGKMFEVSAGSIELAPSNEFYAVFKTTGTSSRELLYLGKEPTFLIEDISPLEDSLWFDVCGSEGKVCRFEKNLPFVF